MRKRTISNKQHLRLIRIGAAILVLEFIVFGFLYQNLFTDLIFFGSLAAYVAYLCYLMRGSV